MAKKKYSIYVDGKKAPSRMSRSYAYKVKKELEELGKYYGQRNKIKVKRVI
jgi:hypothetical protein